MHRIAMAARFPETGTVTYGEGLAHGEEIILVGMLMGAAGKFHCTEGADATNTCSISKTATGYSFGHCRRHVNWHFTADAGAMAVLPDDDYTGYGWWAYKTATGFVVDAFTVESSDASRLTATATRSCLRVLA